LADERLAQSAGISVVDLTALKNGTFTESSARKIARPLNLAEDALVELGKGAWYPADLSDAEGLACFNTAYGDITVNSYLVWDPKTRQGVCFDTGADAGGMLQSAVEKELKIQMILLTHTHPDHIADLARLKRVTTAAAFVCKHEAIDGAESFMPGHKFTVGTLQIETRTTTGHSRGGITYVIHGLPRQIAVVGDAIFAASMGGGAISYTDALRNNRKQILTLPGDTILCPGHGPLTTVAEQQVHNPFFPNR
jgi:hydroxyacylglutathione hydrolase